MDSAVTAAAEDTFTAAPGSVVVVRDQEWLVTNIEKATDGWFVHVQGLSELVRKTEATINTPLGADLTASRQVREQDAANLLTDTGASVMTLASRR